MLGTCLALGSVNMRILIISEPRCSLADFLLKSGVNSLVCVTQGDVHLRSGEGVVISGVDIDCPQKIEIRIPEIKAHLLKAYPLIDRWVSRRQSTSTSIGLLLEYTVSLIQIIGNHSPRVAVLETGAPHHLFTYCLDVALNYLGIRTFYLYGNALDGRCLVAEGNEKKRIVRISDYSAESAVDGYIKTIQKSATYTPADSTRSISPFLHKSALYASYLHFRYLIAKFLHHMVEYRLPSNSSQINLRLPFFSFFEAASIFYEHKKYRELLIAQGDFKASQIQSNDIVYVGHMLPEATSFPESPDYPDEIDVLIDLKNRFPESKIYYREHPAIGIFSEFGHVHFQGLHKCPQFYHQLAHLGVGVVPPSMHISKIRDRGCLFATKTGRVAAENSILGMPTILYGFPFYGIDMPLTFHISKIPLQFTVQNIKELAVSIPNPESAVREYLNARFSGSIENPGISLSPNPSAQPAFQIDFLRLVNHLCIE